jgi:hypothetical protein
MLRQQISCLIFFLFLRVFSASRGGTSNSKTAGAAKAADF